MSIEQLIRRPVHTLPPTATCLEAARLMSHENVGSLVVVSNGTPEGIITDRDLVTRVLAENEDPSRVLLHEVMSRYTAFLSVRRTLDDVIATMRDLGVRRIPVTKENGQLEGIISMDDVLLVLARQLGGLGVAIEHELGQEVGPESEMVERAV